MEGIYKYIEEKNRERSAEEWKVLLDNGTINEQNPYYGLVKSLVKRGKIFVEGQLYAKVSFTLPVRSYKPFPRRFVD